ncbi:MAG: hypothetical protein OXG84_18420 [Chloroflexi bacterium]|nr:hypothetical protein [Chloroflexota bacterium]
MDLLAFFIIASAVGAGLVAWVIVWTTSRASESAITRYFKASEYILDTGEPPPEWRAAPVWKHLLGAAPAKASEEAIMIRLEELIRFFENCSFYEDEFAREQHLSQLEDIRQAWRAGDLS